MVDEAMLAYISRKPPTNIWEVAVQDRSGRKNGQSSERMELPQTNNDSDENRRKKVLMELV